MPAFDTAFAKLLWALVQTLFRVALNHHIGLREMIGLAYLLIDSDQLEMGLVVL